jgi:hypothetical protein
MLARYVKLSSIFISFIRKVFAFLLATRIQHQAGYISNAEWNSFLAGSTCDAPPPQSPAVPDLSLPPVPRELDGLVLWHRVISLDLMLPGLVHSFSSFPNQWLQFIQSTEYLSTQSCVCKIPSLHSLYLPRSYHSGYCFVLGIAITQNTLH